MPIVPTPSLERDAVEAWVQRHLGSVIDGAVSGSERFVGGQQAADRALASFDVAGYAAQRNEVLPSQARGASGLSPWIRHGMLTLPHVWRSVASGPSRDVRKFRDELLWQEYARHRYARLGRSTWSDSIAVDPDERAAGWGAGMACLDFVQDELERTGWLVNQTRMWAASHWAVRRGLPWEQGETEMYRQLLDGSRAANGLGWQWTAGVATGKPYGFSRMQVERRAPELCGRCPLRDACPISDWPDPENPTRLASPAMTTDPSPEATGGPQSVDRAGTPDAVWLTAESMGDDDPALAASFDLPAIFIFDLPLLGQLKLAAKRLVFLAESIADLAERRHVEVRVGDPVAELAGMRLAVTFTPVPGWKRRAQNIDIAALHPWPWLVRPHAGSVASFSAWRRKAGM
jgi:deoxyribodipyrimidine photo-lyase